MLISFQSKHKLNRFQCRDTASTIACLVHCIDNIGHWMAANQLQMNPAKTELLWAGSKSKHNISVLWSPGAWLRYCDCKRPCTGARSHNLVRLKSREACIQDLCTQFLLALLSESLSDKSAAMLVHAFPTSHDYCKAHYAGSPKTITDKLQWVIDAATKLPPCRQWHVEVWPWSVGNTTQWAPLARRARENQRVAGSTPTAALFGQQPWASCSHLMSLCSPNSIIWYLARAFLLKAPYCWQRLRVQWTRGVL